MMLDNQIENTNIVTAENAVIGRLASIIAKRLLNGESIVINNRCRVH